MNKEQIDRMVALHEAGHAVAAYFLKIAFKEIRLQTQNDPCVFGFVDLETGKNVTLDEGDLDERTRVENKIICLFSGPVAECAFTKASPWEAGGSDLEQAVTLGSRRFGYDNKQQFLASMYALWIRAQSLIRSLEAWTCVAAVADELQKSKMMTADQCVRLIQKTQRDWMSKNGQSEIIILLESNDLGPLEAELKTFLSERTDY